ncbi:molybdopterin molybdotransferase MoeA [Hydrogenimonas sp.]
MVTIKEALALIHAQVKAKRTEILPIESALGQISAESLYARFDLPRFDNSAMDGYAVKVEDASKTIECEATILAGEKSDARVTAGKGVRIMTGAPLPEGAEAVIPIENTQEKEDGIHLPESIKQGANIRKKGEDIAKGEIIIEKGERVNSYTITLLASQGVTHLRLFQKPRVTVFATGHELRMHFETIEPHQIYNSNAPMFTARSKELGCDTTFTGATADTMDSIKAHITAALNSDLIVTSGGVSVGDADFTKEAFKKLGMDVLFEKVDIKPGKPTTLGRIGDTWILNLPGNPTAAAVNFELFGRSIIHRLTGMKAPYIAPIETVCGMEKSIKPGRPSVWLGKFDGRAFYPLPKQGPGMVSPLKKADSMILLSPEISELKIGMKVKVVSLHCDTTAADAVDIFT